MSGFRRGDVLSVVMGRPSGNEIRKDRPTFHAAVAGFRFVRRTPLLLGAIALDLFAVHDLLAPRSVGLVRRELRVRQKREVQCVLGGEAIVAFQRVAADADEATRHAAHEGVARCEVRRVRAAKAHGHAKALRRAHRNVRAPLPGGADEGQRHEVGGGHHQGL